jgi:hypothetical protein
VLLLVLILVLIAFGLLVVALLSGSVLWAWVSVGVSVAAAAVLLVDWLQRRSAVRAGADAGDAAAPAVPSQVAGREPVVEPATEVIPAVRTTPPPPPAEPRGGAGDGPPADGDERQQVQETVVLPPLAPSGSSGQPPGAHGGIGPVEPIWSHSVTNVGAPSRPPGAREGDGTPSATQADPDAEDTVKVTGAAPEAPPREEPAGAPPAGGPPRGGPAEAPAGRVVQLPPLGPDGAPPEEPRDADAAALVAGLDDEVLVVDELPRYHLAGCRSLAASPVIPLPAREAVELGFTPCAWCTPDRALSARHRAPVR